MAKVPIFAAVQETYGFVWRERRRFWTLALPGIVVCSLVNGIVEWLMWLALEKPESLDEVSLRSNDWVAGGSLYWPAVLAILLFASAISAAAYAMYMVEEHAIGFLNGLAVGTGINFWAIRVKL